MKFLLLLLFAFPMILWAGVLDTPITLNHSNTPLIVVLQDIEKQSGTTFSFKSTTIKQERNTTVQLDSIPLSEALSLILKNESVRYKAVGEQIIIIPQKTVNKPTLDIKAEIEIEKEIPPIVAIENPPIEAIIVYDTVQYIDTTFVADTIVVVDTVTYYDTITQSVSKKANTQEFLNRFIGIGFEYGMPTKTFERELSSSDDEKSIVESYSYNLFTTSVTGGLMTGKLQVETGLGISVMNSNYSAQTTSVTNTVSTQEESYYEHFLDSTYLLAPNTDTLWFAYSDSTLQTRTIDIPSESLSTEHSENLHSITYLTIPLSIRYTCFDFQERHSFLVGFESETQIQINDVSGTKASLKSGMIPLTKEHVSQVRFSYGASVNYQFSFTDNWTTALGCALMFEQVPLLSDFSQKSLKQVLSFQCFYKF